MMQQPESDSAPRFASEYAQMSESELLALASSYDSLVSPAQDALRAEFAQRKLEPPIVEDPGEVSSQRLVTVRRYRDLGQAIVPRSLLESAGIFCFLQDENFLRVDWGAGIALGGNRLQVRPEDVSAAEEVLNQPMPETIEYDSNAEYTQPHCPRCGSINVATPALYELNLDAPAEGESWRCEACGCQWTEAQDGAVAAADGDA
jgi:hypothetical protein